MCGAGTVFAPPTTSVRSLRPIVRLGVTGCHAFAGVHFIGAALGNVEADQRRQARAAVVLEQANQYCSRGEPTEVGGGTAAAVGAHDQAGGQRRVRFQEFKLFDDGPSAIASSVQALTELGQTVPAIDYGGKTDLNHKVLADMDMADGCGRQLGLSL